MNKTISRPLGTNEKVFWILDQKNTTQFAVIAEIDGNLINNAWRQALVIVQKRHPFGLKWAGTLDSGKFIVADEVDIVGNIQLIKQVANTNPLRLFQRG